jgi:hypothetical protein
VVFTVESVTLAFKGLSVEGAKMGLVIGTLYEDFDNTRAEAWPTGPFVAYSPRVLLITSQFAQAFSTTPIKTVGGS